MFDFFGTLTPPLSEPDVRASMAAVGRILGADPGVFVEAMMRSWPDRAVGAFGSTRETLAAIARLAGATPSDRRVAEAVESRMASFRSFCTLRAEALYVLEALRERGVAVAVVSDCGPELPELWDALAVSSAVDARVLSAELGIKKPGAVVFVTVATRLGVPPERCWYVGDGGSDELDGSRRVGMHPVWLRDPAGGGFRRDFVPGADVTVIESLDEVLDLIDM